jgi:preprotein translocase subunit SecG
MPFLIRFSLGFLLVFMAFFLIALVLIQRGRGGGLAGAFGGAGGQSAFGTKAGDVFTRITVGVAACWILLCILAINVLGTSSSRIAPNLGGATQQKVPSDIPETPPSSDKPAAPSDDTKPGDAAAESKPADAAKETSPPAKDSEGKADAEAPKPDTPEASAPSDPSAKPAAVSEKPAPEPAPLAAE